MKPALLLLGLAAWAASGVPAPVDVQQEVSPKEVKLGAPFTVDVSITHPAGQRYELVSPTQDGPFEALGHTRERQDGSPNATTRFHVRFGLFELGAQSLPPLVFEVTEGGKVSRWTAPSVEVIGLPTLPPDAEKQGADLLDITPPETLWVRSYRVFAWVAAALLGGYLLWRAFRWWRRRPRAATPVRPPDPLDVRTLAALDRLAREDLPSRGKVREHYFRLSEILRGYLAERYRIDALECTSGELLDRITRVSTPGLPISELRTFLEESDLVKFARQEAPPAACASALQFGHRLVRQTTHSATPSHASGPSLSAP